ncbi:radical SAM protein [Candidatus Dependentiae bacterium]|nr:MAG: radical SAM protein [Candidatus Dependentiae bacterium]
MNAYIARICTSFIDVPGKIAVAVYFAGCSLRCKDCQNKELWDPHSGILMTLDTVDQQINAHQLADSVVFLGGEPTDQMPFLKTLCQKIRDKERVLYTGREFEELPPSLIEHLDMIICGPYRSDLHIDSWPASKNQRVFVKKGSLWKSQTT